MKKFIVIEGLDGSGKTTTAQAVAEQLSYDYMEWMTEPYSIKPLLANECVTDDSKHLLSIASTRHLSDVIKQKLGSGKGVVVSRYVDSMVWYYRGFCLLNNTKPLMLDPYQMGCLKADTTILLKVSEEERLRRMTNRNETNKGEVLLESQSDFKQLIENGLEQDIDHIIETDGLTVDDIVARVIALTQ